MKLPRVRDRIFIVPSYYGALYLIGLVYALFYGTAGNHRILTGLGIGLFVLLLMGMNDTNTNLKGLHLVRWKSLAGPKGGTAKLQVVIENQSQEPRYTFQASCKIQRKRQKRDIPLLLPRSQVQVEFDLPASHRGTFEIPDVQIRTVFPLGLLFAWKIFETSETYFVYPTPSGTFRLPQTRISNFSGAIGLSDSWAEEFMGHRLYHPGDSFKQVDWKALARGLDLLTKQFGAAQKPCSILSWYDLEPLPLEARLSQLTQWVLAYHARAIPYVLILPPFQIGPGCGIDHQNKCLLELARYGT